MRAASKVKIPDSDEVIYLTIEEQVQFIDSIYDGAGLTGKQIAHHNKVRDRDVALVLLLLDTGMRISELHNSNIRDVDFKTCAIRIIRKGGKTQTLYFSDETKERLLYYLQQRNAICKYNEKSPLFSSTDDKRLSIQAIESLFKKYQRAIFPGRKISPHKMRSSFAMAFYGETTDILALQKKLGHKTLAATNIYAKASNEQMKETRSILENARKKIQNSD